jgi:fatty acid desaturase
MSARASRHRPPAILNVVALVALSAIYLLLLYAASRATTIAGLAVAAALFAVAMIPIYSLIHEAEHDMLVPSTRWNGILGTWLCALFGVSFAFLRHCHLRHHRMNRTDNEIWDLYLPHQQKWKRRVNLYLMLCGSTSILLWLSVVLFAIAPSLVYGPPFRWHAEVAEFLEGSNREAKIRQFRRESWMVIALAATLFLGLQLELGPCLVLFAVHGFVWSSQTYANHAYSRRDIVNGAHNLEMPAWLLPVYLNFNLHLAHHQHPHVPWIHLPAMVQPNGDRIGFFRNYMRLWRGPEPTHECAPSRRSHAE